MTKVTPPSASPVLDRRQLGAAALAGALLAAGSAGAQTDLEAQHKMNMPRPADAGPPIKVAMLLYPRMVLLDLVGPQTILTVLGADIHLVGQSMTPMSTDVGIPVTPTMTFAECLRDLDVLFVPGGLMGSIACMGNEAVLGFLADRGERVVHDRNRLTGSGGTAGLDFGLTLAALLRSQAEAERVQLILEYAPQPPFHAGTPEEVGPERLAQARARRTWMDATAHEAAVAAARRLGI